MYGARGLALGMWAVVATACAPMAAEEGEPERGLLPSLQVYTSGGEVTFVFQVTNVTAEEIRLPYRTGQSFDIAVQRGEREVWRWSEGQRFTQALREEIVEPGESLHFEATWQPDPGTAGGEYSASAWLTADVRRVEQSTRFALP